MKNDCHAQTKISQIPQKPSAGVPPQKEGFPKRTGAYSWRHAPNHYFFGKTKILPFPAPCPAASKIFWSKSGGVVQTVVLKSTLPFYSLFTLPVTLYTLLILKNLPYFFSSISIKRPL